MPTIPTPASAQPPRNDGSVERGAVKIPETSPKTTLTAPSPVTAKSQTARAATAATNAARISPAAAAAAAAETPDTAQQQPAQSTTAAISTAQPSSHAQHAAGAHGVARAAPTAAQVAREIIRRIDGGNTSFELRLDPPELGRVEVRMEVSRDNRVTAMIAADSPQALTELARHARELEAQLQSAGLELSENGLSFDLRQGGQGGEAEDANADGGAHSGAGAADEQQQVTHARPIGFERWRGVRVDMMV